MSDSDGQHHALPYVPASLTQALDLLPMLQAVSTGLDLLQPWISTEKDKLPAKVEPFVDKVREQSGKYHEALSLSGVVAQDGFNWTLDMEGYCAVLKRGSDNSELLNGYIKLMRAGAKDAQRRAIDLSERFLSVSVALGQVMNDAKSVAEASAEAVKTSAAQIQENTEKWEKAQGTMKNVNRAIYAWNGARLARAALLGPPAFMVEAASIAIGYGVGLVVEQADVHLNENRIGIAIANQLGVTEENTPAASAVLAKNALTEVEVIRYLGAVIGGIELIIKHVDVVAKWWGDMNTELEAIEQNTLARLERQTLAIPGGSDPNTANANISMDPACLRASIELIQDSIKKRKEDFKQYKHQIHALQMRNPPPRPAY